MSQKSTVPAPDEVDTYRMPLMEHLRELRDRLLRALAAVVVGVVVCFIFAEEIFAFLARPILVVLEARGEGTLAILDPLEAVIVYLKVSVTAGFVLASPVVAWQTWAFVAPGLYKTERYLVAPLVASSTALFLGGAAFGYFVIFRYGFEFFLSVLDVNTSAVLSMASYLKTATRLLLAFGLSFQLPVVVFFLARIGLVDARDLTGGFRYAVPAIFVVAAVITPPDILTQTLMAIPLMVLYGVGIIVARVFSTKQREAKPAAT